MNEFYLGLCVGGVQTVIGHPLDTIKTCQQNNQRLLYNLNLYRGLSYPLYSSTLINGFLFYSNDVMKKYTYNNYLSGFATGLLCSPMINVFETYKVKKQTNQLVRLNDLFSYSKKGLSATLVRESIGTSIYFGTYHNFRSFELSPFISGSLSGLLSWLLTYPVDVIKSRIQSGLDKTWKSAIKRSGLMYGVSICLVRSFIVNGFSFSAYDYLKNNYTGK